MRVNVLDASGVCLCDKILDWTRPSSSADLSKLILSFYQISSQLGHPEGPSEILFSNPSELNKKQKRARRQVKAKPDTPREDELPIRLIAVRLDQTIVGAFHRSATPNPSYDSKLKKILSTIASQFNKTYATQLDQLRGTNVFKDIIEERSKQPLKQEDILKQFSKFEELITHKSARLNESMKQSQSISAGSGKESTPSQ